MSNQSFYINGHMVGAECRPYLIAEMSANHNGSIENAFSIIEHAKKSGAHAVKLQTYRPDTITLNSNSKDFLIDSGLWAGKTLYELYSEAHLPWDWHKPLFEYAKKINITIFSSPFDFSAIDLLEDLNAPAYKIASFEAIDLPLIKYAAGTGKPLIISTGMADLEEINEAIDAAYSAGCKDLAVLHCVSGYPAPAVDYNLRTITDMRSRFGIPVGLSDHTLDNTTAIAAVALGACIVEKHFTLDKNGGGADDSFSLEPSDFYQLAQGVNIAWESLGSIDYGRKSSEQGNIRFRRSLYFVKNLNAGDIVTPDVIRSVRPGFGVPPKFIDVIIGRKVKHTIAENTPVSFDLLEE